MTRLTVVLVLVSILAIVAYATARPSSSPRTCFPAAKWGPAPDRLRPCARIVRVFEDGSVQLAVEDASGRVRWRATVGARDD
jgi:hypothetical protein